MNSRLDTKTKDYHGAFDEANPPKPKRIEKARVEVIKESFETEEINPEPYVPSEDLKEAVNLAMRLGRPLLLQGDPGCGKTRLAYSVAFEMALPLEECYIKSTSRAQDFLYTYDAIKRLYDSQMGERGARDQKRQLLSPEIRNYIHYGPLGRAIIRARYGRRSAVLIDEIDKADIDFPNDLLFELDRLAFQVAEVEDLRFAVPQDRPELRPLVFVTHNEEKALPPAFLRRCIYFYVEMPEEEKELLRILKVHGLGDDALTRKACQVLNRLRKMDLSKKPGLSELIDWVGYARYKNLPPDELDKLCYPGVLLKQHRDQLRARKETDQGQP